MVCTSHDGDQTHLVFLTVTTIALHPAFKKQLSLEMLLCQVSWTILLQSLLLSLIIAYFLRHRKQTPPPQKNRIATPVGIPLNTPICGCLYCGPNLRTTPVIQ